MESVRKIVIGFCALALTLCEVHAQDSGLILHLPLDGDIRDRSANQHFVTNNNALVFRDRAAWFSGNETGIGITNINLASRPFTVCMWIKVSGTQMMYGLVEQLGAKRRHHWLHLMLRGARQPYLGFYINDAISPRGIQGNKWTHLLFSYDGTHQMIWIDGEAACARKARPYRGSGHNTLWVGRSPRWNNVPSHDFQGGMRDFRIYDRVLTVKEIYELADRLIRLPASLGVSGVPKPAEMPASLSRARDGGLPYLLIDNGRLTIGGEHAQIYEIEAASRLGIPSPWKSLGLITNLNGRAEFVDPGHSPQRQRFYRIKHIGAR